MELISTVGLLLVATVTAGPADSREANAGDLARRVQSLVARINENHDLLHSEVTSAGLDLQELGLPALRHGALELIVSDDRDTRRRGSYVLGSIVQDYFGVSGRGWLDTRRREEFLRLWQALGDYDHDLPEPERRECYRQWKAWLATVEELTPRSNPNRLRPPRVDPPSTGAP
jgi:hypothetical protein